MRCVSDQPWVTGAETCELVMALDAVGDRARAIELYAAIQHLRHDDGGYWTGWQFANQAYFPAERSSWTAAAMILAADALSGATGGSALFREAGARPAPAAPRRGPAACGCAARPGTGANRRESQPPVRRQARRGGPAALNVGARTARTCRGRALVCSPDSV